MLDRKGENCVFLSQSTFHLYLSSFNITYEAGKDVICKYKMKQGSNNYFTVLYGCCLSKFCVTYERRLALLKLNIVDIPSRTSDVREIPVIGSSGMPKMAWKIFLVWSLKKNISKYLYGPSVTHSKVDLEVGSPVLSSDLSDSPRQCYIGSLLRERHCRKWHMVFLQCRMDGGEENLKFCGLPEFVQLFCPRFCF